MLVGLLIPTRTITFLWLFAHPIHPVVQYFSSLYCRLSYDQLEGGMSLISGLSLGKCKDFKRVWGLPGFACKTSLVTALLSLSIGWPCNPVRSTSGPTGLCSFHRVIPLVNISTIVHPFRSMRIGNARPDSYYKLIRFWSADRPRQDRYSTAMKSSFNNRRSWTCLVYPCFVCDMLKCCVSCESCASHYPYWCFYKFCVWYVLKL